ncbi:MAG: hypothetical protein ACYCT7_08940 [bacterium]
MKRAYIFIYAILIVIILSGCAIYPLNYGPPYYGPPPGHYQEHGRGHAYGHDNGGN